MTLLLPKATMAVRTETLACDVHHLNQEHVIISFVIGGVCAAPACQT
jgi:hypothetical protein